MKITTQNQNAKGQQQDDTMCDDSIVMQSTFGASTHPYGSAPLAGLLNLRTVFGLKF